MQRLGVGVRDGERLAGIAIRFDTLGRMLEYSALLEIHEAEQTGDVKHQVAAVARVRRRWPDLHEIYHQVSMDGR